MLIYLLKYYSPILIFASEPHEKIKSGKVLTVDMTIPKLIPIRMVNNTGLS